MTTGVLVGGVAYWVGPGTPVGQEHGQTDGLEDAGKGANGDGVKWALLGEDLGNEL